MKANSSKSKLKKVYVAYRYNDTDANQVLSNIGVAHKVAFDFIKEGYIPFIPHTDCLLAIMFGKSIPLKFYYEYSIEFLKVCDIFCLVEDGKPLSSGVQTELELAQKLGIPIITRKAMKV